MSALIRRMQDADYPAVRRLWLAADLTDEPEDGETEIATFLIQPQSAGFVAEEAGSLVGAALCGSDGRYGYIHHLAVHRGARRRGIGRLLADACATYLNMRHVLVIVRDDNAGAREFWRRLPFTPADNVRILFQRRAG